VVVVVFVGCPLFKCFLLEISLQLDIRHNSQDSLPAFTLLDHTFDAIHSTIRTCDLSISSDVISLHHIASDFPRATGRASLCSALLDGLWIAICVKIS
jgi:hypothetical protein